MTKNKVTRIEIIDQEGRSFVKYYDEPMAPRPVFQDDDRTLKIFVECACDIAPIPHNHLEDDGESHDIRPNIKKG